MGGKRDFVSRRVQQVSWMLLSGQAPTSKNNLLSLLLINVVLISVFSLEWETSQSVAFARPRAQGLMCQAFSAPLKMKQLMKLNIQGKTTGLPAGSRSSRAGREGYELKVSKHFVCRCLSVPFRRMVLEEVSLWEGRQTSPKDQQAGTSPL